MSDWFGSDDSWEGRDVNGDKIVVSEQDKSLKEKHDEITRLNEEIAGIIEELKGNPALLEFADKAKKAGPLGVMGLLPKVGELLPQLAPLGEVIQKLVEVGEKQHALTGEIVAQIEGV